jgi:hypothetical protein
MNLSSLVLPLAALALAAPSAYAETAPASAEAQQDARIPFANNGGIRDWRSHDKDVLYVQDRQQTWYKATLMAPAFDLDSAQAIGFDTGPTDTFDRFSTVVVRGQRYAVQSLVRIEGKPPTRKEARAARDDT